MVGATGFEPATTGPPVQCATGLRYAPSVPQDEAEVSQKPRGASRSQPGAQPRETVTDPSQGRRVGGLLETKLELLGALARLCEQPLLGALERQPLVVEQGADALDEIEVAPPVHTLPAGILLRTEQLEFRLPVAEDVRGHTRDRFDFADPVVELLGGLRRHAVVWLLIRCLSPLLGLKVKTLRAVISMLSPVWGFRPRREALRRIRKCPKPTIFTSSLFSKHRKMISKTDSTTDADCRFDSPCAATALTRSFFVTVSANLLRARSRARSGPAHGRDAHSLPRAMNVVNPFSSSCFAAATA